MASTAAVKTLFNMACGQHPSEPAEPVSTARTMQLAVLGLGASLALAAVWGVGAGAGNLDQMLGNLLRVPALVLLSTLAAMPAGLLAWKLGGVRERSANLLLAHSSSLFGGMMVLASLTPVVALYYHSSTWAGPALAMGSVVVCVAVAVFGFVRRVLGGVLPAQRRKAFMAVAVFAVMQLATLVQLLALLGPVLPEVTMFDAGVDGLLGR